MFELGYHNLYHPALIAKILRECGLAVTTFPNCKGIEVENTRINIMNSEWGVSGLSAIAVLAVVYKLAVEHPAKSSENGLAAWYGEALQQLADFWNIDLLA